MLLGQEADQLMAQGKYSLARPLYEHLVQMAETSFGPEHPALAATLTDLAQALLFLGDYPSSQVCGLMVSLFSASLSICCAKVV